MKQAATLLMSAGALWLTSTTTFAYVTTTAPLVGRSARQRTTPLAAVSSLLPQDDSMDPRVKSFSLTTDEIKPLFQFGSSPKIVNAFGLWCAAVSLVTGPLWMAAMMLVEQIHQQYPNWDPHRATFDATGKLWARIWLTLTFSFPTMTGHIDRLDCGPCLYVANHASWLDIPILCTALDPVFKFIAKGELSAVPCIGQQLAGGHHILIDRDDRRSQLRTFKEGIAWLKKGVPIMAFPEGMRSKDGRLMPFKGGLFSIAVKCGVPIVPISLSHAHAVMPASSLFPIQPGQGKLRLHVHEQIDAAGKTEAELVQLVRNAFLEQLPLEQHPVEPYFFMSPVIRTSTTTNGAATAGTPSLQHHHSLIQNTLHVPSSARVVDDVVVATKQTETVAVV